MKQPESDPLEIEKSKPSKEQQDNTIPVVGVGDKEEGFVMTRSDGCLSPLNRAFLNMGTVEISSSCLTSLNMRLSRVSL